MWYPALPLDELKSSTAHRLVLDEQPVCIALVDDQVRAISDLCPHRGASLSQGLLRNGCVTCPAHLWRFSFLDGTKQGDDRVRVRVYPTRVVNGIVEIEVPALPPKQSLREVLLAHARGETASGGVTS